MKKQTIILLLISYFGLFYTSSAQTERAIEEPRQVSALFSSEKILPLKMHYSNKVLKKDTNDSTYIDSDLSVQLEDGSWKVLEIKLRARGNFRRRKCYFPPAKLKIKKSVAKGTVFEGNKKLKLVLPCLLQNSSNDEVVKEYMAYKLYEVIAPYHFKTRIVEIDLAEEKGNSIKDHHLKGILIEDDELIAKRHNGNVLDRSVHPLQQDAKTSVENAFFQYMIANTDFSTAFQHNEKLLFIDKKTMPIPYDFDMCGLVDASYAVVSQVQGESMDITDVKQRYYRGFKRSPEIYTQVREAYLSHKTQFLAVVDQLGPYFENPKEHAIAKEFIEDFFPIIENEKTFKLEILDKARVK